MNTYGKRGILVRLLYLMVAMLWYVLTLGGRLGRESVVVLCYHGILFDHRKMFQWQMSRISGKTVEASDFAQLEVSQILERPKICITFDDAFANLLDNALPVLELYRIPAIVFAVGDNLGEKPNWFLPPGHPESNEMVMSLEQLANISKSSLVRIGSHTLTHPDLVKSQSGQIRTELVESKQKLESLLGFCVEDIALPYGSNNEETLTLAQEAGYKRVYTLNPRPTCPLQGNPVIDRFSMSPDVWKIEFLLTCAGAYAWLYPWRNLLRIIRAKNPDSRKK